MLTVIPLINAIVATLLAVLAVLVLARVYNFRNVIVSSHTR